MANVIKQNAKIILTAVGAAYVTLCVVVLVLLSGNGTPEPISRAELLERYAEINPFDRTATPKGVDSAARTLCNGLDKGATTDAMITSVNEIYGADSTEVTRLLVSYGCPGYLEDFK